MNKKRMSENGATHVISWILGALFVCLFGTILYGCDPITSDRLKGSFTSINLQGLFGNPTFRKALEIDHSPLRSLTVAQKRAFDTATLVPLTEFIEPSSNRATISERQPSSEKQGSVTVRPRTPFIEPGLGALRLGGMCPRVEESDWVAIEGLNGVHKQLQNETMFSRDVYTQFTLEADRRYRVVSGNQFQPGRASFRGDLKGTPLYVGFLPLNTPGYPSYFLGIPLCANMSGTHCLSSIRVAGGGDAPHHAW